MNTLYNENIVVLNGSNGLEVKNIYGQFVNFNENTWLFPASVFYYGKPKDVDQYSMTVLGEIVNDYSITLNYSRLHENIENMQSIFTINKSDYTLDVNEARMIVSTYDDKPYYIVNGYAKSEIVHPSCIHYLFTDDEYKSLKYEKTICGMVINFFKSLV